MGLNMIQFCSISVSFGSMYFIQLPKSFLIVRFFNWISCNKGLKAKISCFFLCFFCLNLLGLECSRIRKTTSFLPSHRPKLQECGKCCKSPIFEGNLQVFISYVSEMKTVICPITLPCFNTFYSLFIPFFVLEIFKFKYGQFFCQNSISISKFE